MTNIDQEQWLRHELARAYGARPGDSDSAARIMKGAIIDSGSVESGIDDDSAATAPPIKRGTKPWLKPLIVAAAVSAIGASVALVAVNRSTGRFSDVLAPQSSATQAGSSQPSATKDTGSGNTISCGDQVPFSTTIDLTVILQGGASPSATVTNKSDATVYVGKRATLATTGPDGSNTSYSWASQDIGFVDPIRAIAPGQTVNIEQIDYPSKMCDGLSPYLKGSYRATLLIAVADRLDPLSAKTVFYRADDAVMINLP